MIDYNFLVQKAQEYAQKSYSPYSNFSVGAALLTSSGKIFGGANIENASYGATVCAERVAMFTAIADGELDFTAIAVVSKNENPCFPCGICRQVFTEFSPSMEVVMLSDGAFKIYKASELLPYAFNLKAVENK
jgi:cytidine deaminase